VSGDAHLHTSYSSTCKEVWVVGTPVAIRNAGNIDPRPGSSSIMSRNEQAVEERKEKGAVAPLLANSDVPCVEDARPANGAWLAF
jgi:hypothetical protein